MKFKTEKQVALAGLFLLVLAAITLGIVYRVEKEERERQERLRRPLPTETPINLPATPSLTPMASSPISEAAAMTPLPSPHRLIQQEVPFTPQAPRANWQEKLYQNACEEASILMAASWVTGKGITTADAMREIRKLAEMAEEEFGHHLDESASDTAKLTRKYVPEAEVALREDATIRDMVEAVSKGHILMAPTNGQLLKNPNYTPPGPLRHMVVVIGFDPASDEFITNDPGTKQGKGWRYKSKMLYQAMQDYGTGDNTPIVPDRKVIIEVGRTAAQAR